MLREVEGLTVVGVVLGDKTVQGGELFWSGSERDGEVQGTCTNTESDTLP